MLDLNLNNFSDNIIVSDNESEMIGSLEAYKEFFSMIKEDIEENFMYHDCDFIDKLFDGVEEKFVAFENALAIQDHIEKYGVSEELLSLTGYSSEGILKTIGSAIASFFKWLWDFLKNLCNRFMEFIDGAVGGGSSDVPSGSGSGNNPSSGVIKTVKKALTDPAALKKLKDIPLKKLSEVDVPENFDKFAEAVRNINKPAIEFSKPVNDQSGDDYFKFSFEKMKEAEKYFNDTFTSIKWVKTKDLDTAEYNASRSLDKVFDLVDTHKALIERYKAIQSLKIPSTTDTQEVQNTLKKINDILKFNFKFSYSEEKKDIQERVKLLRTYIASVNKLFKIFFKTCIIVRRVAFRVYTQLIDPNQSDLKEDKAAVLVYATPPHHLIEKLREIWGFKDFYISRIVLTNIGDFFNNKGLAGWVQPSEHGRKNTSVLFCNISRYYKDKTFSQVFLNVRGHYNEYKNDSPDMYEMPNDKIDAFISTIIHESRHILQNQLEDPNLDKDRPSPFASLIQTRQDHVDYLRRNVEREARRAAHEYVTKYITDEDRKWAKAMIVKAIKQEKGLMKVYRPEMKKK